MLLDGKNKYKICPLPLDAALDSRRTCSMSTNRLLMRWLRRSFTRRTIMHCLSWFSCRPNALWPATSIRVGAASVVVSIATLCIILPLTIQPRAVASLSALPEIRPTASDGGGCLIVDEGGPCCIAVLGSYGVQCWWGSDQWSCPYVIHKNTNFNDLYMMPEGWHDDDMWPSETYVGECWYEESMCLPPPDYCDIGYTSVKRVHCPHWLEPPYSHNCGTDDPQEPD